MTSAAEVMLAYNEAVDRKREELRAHLRGVEAKVAREKAAREWVECLTRRIQRITNPDPWHTALIAVPDVVPGYDQTLVSEVVIGRGAPQVVDRIEA